MRSRTTRTTRISDAAIIRSGVALRAPALGASASADTHVFRAVSLTFIGLSIVCAFKHACGYAYVNCIATVSFHSMVLLSQ
jgi:hypothetical protein